MIIFCPQKNRINNQILNNGLEINLIFTTLDKETVLNISILAQENNSIEYSNSDSVVFFNNLGKNLPFKNEQTEIKLTNFNLNSIIPDNKAFYNVVMNDGVVNFLLFKEPIYFSTYFFKKFVNQVIGGISLYQKKFNALPQKLINPLTITNAIFFNENMKVTAQIQCDSKCNLVNSSGSNTNNNSNVVSSKTTQKKCKEDIIPEEEFKNIEDIGSIEVPDIEMDEEECINTDLINENKNISKLVSTNPVTIVMVIIFSICVFILISYMVFKKKEGCNGNIFWILFSLFTTSFIMFLIFILVSSFKQFDEDENNNNKIRGKYISTMWVFLFLTIMFSVFTLVYSVICNKNLLSNNNVNNFSSNGRKIKVLNNNGDNTQSIIFK